jgi:16S rRNA processing protein RimM
LSKERPGPPPLVGLGQVSGAHGIRGAVKVRADAQAATTDPEVFAALGKVTIGGHDYKILEVGRHKNQIILYLEGVATRSQAEALTGQAVAGDPRRFPELPPGEYYWFQVLGLPVYEAGDGALLGYLEEVIPTPAHDVYAVRLKKREVLLPAVAEVVLEINLSERFIKVSLPKGLLETYAD